MIQNNHSAIQLRCKGTLFKYVKWCSAIGHHAYPHHPVLAIPMKFLHSQGCIMYFSALRSNWRLEELVTENEIHQDHHFKKLSKEDHHSMKHCCNQYIPHTNVIFSRMTCFKKLGLAGRFESPVRILVERTGLAKRFFLLPLVLKGLIT
ncbi:hypothetical protein TNCV_3658071 [Trichonephila clavipes]|nr:hypothetical protein TNCV_3658071 [Trichonephila clavipes]